MSTTQDLITQRQQINGALLEKVIIKNDLSSLTPIEKVQHVKNVCDSLGLNPLTKPIQLITFQGKEIPYFTKDATEQLRKLNKVSITNVETKILEGSIYVVTAHASTADGRTDAATGAVNIKGKNGDELCNAMLKAETKAKRRVTLSICGLGYIDECEAESITGAKKVDMYVEKDLDRDETILNDVLYEVKNAENIEQLQAVFNSAQKRLKGDKDSLIKLIESKDKRKDELLTKKEEIDALDIDFETGEVK